MIGRAAATALVVALAVATVGCSTLRPTPTEDEASASVSAGERSYTLVIEAPRELRGLLERHLDLARFRETTGADALTATELERLAAAAPAQARALLETEGWFAPTVTVQRLGGDPPILRLLVEPGPRTVVGRLTIELQGELGAALAANDSDAVQTRRTVEQAWPLGVGKPFRQGAWDDAKNALLAQVRAAGYAAASWSGTAAQIDAQTHQARLVVVADSGPLFRIGEMRIEGLERYDEHVVRNLADFASGAVATEKRLLDYQERLQGAGFFESATVEIESDPATATATALRIRVRESPAQQATVGVGISANVGQRVSLEHLHRRVFGWPAALKNKLEVGRDRRAWDVELRSHPLRGLYRDLASASVERLESADEVRLAWNTRLGRAQDTQRIERLYFVELQSATVKTALTRQLGDALSLNYHYAWRDLDNAILPTDGVTLSTQGAAGYARSNFAASGAFGRATARVTAYRPLGRTWYGQGRVELGQIYAADNVGLPDTLLFRAGGDDSVRGYAYRTLGPLDANGIVGSGRSLATLSAELARPIAADMPTLWGAAFVDAGNAARTWREMTLAVGAGFGLRWRSPVGPLRVDLAFGERIRKWRLHLSVGIAL